MMKVVGNKLMTVCANCGKIIRVDKPVFGSMHICTLPEERKLYRDVIAARVADAENQLKNA